jgi:hypothetical protein
MFVCVCIVPLVYYMTFSFYFEECCFCGIDAFNLLEIYRYFKRA